MSKNLKDWPAHIPEARRNNVLIIGSVTVDITTFSARLPNRGETIIGEDVSLVLGGKGANQAVAAARAGAASYLVGCVGADAFQQLVLGALENEGVQTKHLRIMEGATGIAHIRVDGSGENDIVVVPKANSLLNIEHVTSAFEEIAPTAAVLLVQLEIPWPSVLQAMKLARAEGLLVVLDPAPAPVVPLPESVWAMADMVTPNETEATIITGINVVDADSAREAGRWFLERGTTAALITLASTGAVLVTAGGGKFFEAVPVIAVDTTAAGDSFAGYLGASLAQGKPLEECIREAMAAGALAVTARGASSSIPFRRDVDELLGG